jgi:hypothetical protein
MASESRPCGLRGVLRSACPPARLCGPGALGRPAPACFAVGSTHRWVGEARQPGLPFHQGECFLTGLLGLWGAHGRAAVVLDAIPLGKGWEMVGSCPLVAGAALSAHLRPRGALRHRRGVRRNGWGGLCAHRAVAQQGGERESEGEFARIHAAILVRGFGSLAAPLGASSTQFVRPRARANGLVGRYAGPPFGLPCLADTRFASVRLGLFPRSKSPMGTHRGLRDARTCQLLVRGAEKRVCGCRVPLTWLNHAGECCRTNAAEKHLLI